MTNLTAMGLRVMRILARWAVPVLLLTAVSCQVWAQSKPPMGSFALRLELKSNPQGTDLGSFLRDMYKSIKDKAQATMPSTILRGEHGNDYKSAKKHLLI